MDGTISLRISGARSQRPIVMRSGARHGHKLWNPMGHVVLVVFCFCLTCLLFELFGMMLNFDYEVFSTSFQPPTSWYIFRRFCKTLTCGSPGAFQELLGEWTQVASTRQYCPSQNDINRPLRMATWIHKLMENWQTLSDIVNMCEALGRGQVCEIVKIHPFAYNLISCWWFVWPLLTLNLWKTGRKQLWE